MESSEDYLSRLESYIGTWLVEKSQSVLKNAVESYEDFRRREDLPEDFAEAFRSSLYPILYNSTKILSFATGKEWSTKEPDLIWEKGRDGLDEVLVKYGCLAEGETVEGKKRIQAQNFASDLKELKQLLSKPRCPSRTLIQELLMKQRKIGIQDPILDEISGLIESVTMGELSWDECADSASRLVEKLIAIYPLRNKGRLT